MDSRDSFEGYINPIEHVKKQLDKAGLFIYHDRIANDGQGYEQIIAYVKQRGLPVYAVLRVGSPIPSRIADANIRHVEYYEDGPESEATAMGRLGAKIRLDERLSN